MVIFLACQVTVICSLGLGATTGGGVSSLPNFLHDHPDRQCLPLETRKKTIDIEWLLIVGVSHIATSCKKVFSCGAQQVGVEGCEFEPHEMLLQVPAGHRVWTSASNYGL